jgi:hypothetical protein
MAMKEVQHALDDISLELREALGGQTARKILGGKGRPGDYLQHMLTWLGRRVGKTPPQSRGQSSDGRRPSVKMVTGRMEVAVQTDEFKRASGQLAAKISTFASLANFPNLDAIRRDKATEEAWLEFRKLVRASVPQRAGGVTEPTRPPWGVLPERCSRRGVEQPGLLLRADARWLAVRSGTPGQAPGQ